MGKELMGWNFWEGVYIGGGDGKEGQIGVCA
jgi:hypothetical protein